MPTIMPPNVSTYGHQVDDLMMLITYLTVGCLFIAEALLFYMLYRFRRKEGAKPAYITGETWGQLKWVMIPVLIVVGLDVYIDLENGSAWKVIKETLPTKGMHVRITAQQFAWTFTVPAKGDELDGKTDIVTTGELHVPVGTNILFDLESKDVLHSLWIPALRLKQDAVPGRTIQGWFQATRPGVYDIACAEICGGEHAKMAARLVVGEPADMEAWRQKSSTANASPGMKLLAAKSCTACHSLDGSRRIGPSLKGIYGTQVTVVTDGAKREVTIDDEYLRRSILEPGADVVDGYSNVMPSQRKSLTDAEIDEIIDFIKTLK